jgi:hypothetical protein
LVRQSYKATLALLFLAGNAPVASWVRIQNFAKRRIHIESEFRSSTQPLFF